MQLWLLLLVALWHNLVRHEPVQEETNQAAEVDGSETTLVAPCGLAHTHTPKNFDHSTPTWIAPLCRQETAEEPRKDGTRSLKRPVEMRALQASQQAKRPLLRCLWITVATVLGQDISASIYICHGFDHVAKLDRRYLGAKAKEPTPQTGKEPQNEGQSRWKGEVKQPPKQQLDRTKDIQVAGPSFGLLADQGDQSAGAFTSKTFGSLQATRVLCRSAGVDCHTPSIVPRRTSTRDTVQSRQDQEDIAHGSQAAYQPNDESQEGAGFTERSQEATYGLMEAACGILDQEYQGTAHAVPECHSGLPCLRGGIDVTIPAGKDSHLPHHPAEQASGSRPRGIERSRRQHGRWDTNGTNQCGGGDGLSNGSQRRSRQAATNPSDPQRVCCLFRHSPRQVQIPWKRRNYRTGNKDDPQGGGGFMRCRSGTKPTVQSVATERDRSRNLRFSLCVGVCEHCYEGVADETQHLHQDNFVWTMLAEPKQPTSTPCKIGMTTTDASVFGHNHSIFADPTFLNPWQATVQAFELQLEVDNIEAADFMNPMDDGDQGPCATQYRHSGIAEHTEWHIDYVTEPPPAADAAEDTLIIVDEWQYLHDLLLEEIDAGTDEMELEMHGLKLEDVGQRHAASGLSFEDIRDAVRRTWDDWIGATDTVFLHPLRPQESAQGNKLQLIVEILEAEQQLPPNFVAIVQRVHSYRDAATTTRALYELDWTSNREMLQNRVLVDMGCDSMYQCNIHIEGRIALPHRRHELRRGSFVEIFIHNVPDTDEMVEDDPSSFMQRVAPSRAPNLVRVRLVGRHKITATITMDTTEQFSQQLEAHWPFLQRPYDSIAEIHEVTEPPTFSGVASPMYILEFRYDRFSQINTDDVLVVTTIIFDGQETDPRQERFRVQWMQCKMNRDNVLDHFRATWLCRQSTALCGVYHNGQHWPMADPTIRHLDNGDHIRLQVRTTGPRWCDMEHSERIERHRRVYASSTASEDEDQGQPEDPDAAQSDSEPSSRHSRSRRRRREADSDENAARSESTSLLQKSLSLQKNNHRPVLQDITNSPDWARVPGLDAAQELLDMERPHVSDRWCAKPFPAALESRSVSRVPLVLSDLLQQAVRMFPLPGTPDIPFAIELWNIADPLELQRELDTWCPDLQAWPLTDDEKIHGYLCGKVPEDNLTVYWHIKDMQLAFPVWKAK